MRPRMTKRGLATLALYVAAVVWVFSGPLLSGRVLYFRDITYTYYPDYVFVARSLARGVWPLWHPGAAAGTPFLMAYPVDLLLLLAFGARATLALSPPLHVLLAMGSMALLARRLGMGTAGAALAGATFGLSGMMLGSVLYPVFLAAAWAPLAVALFLSLVDSEKPRRVAALLALVLAVQASTLGAEAVIQTAIVALALLPRLPGRKVVIASLGAVGLAALLAAPALLGIAAVLHGTARGSGFSPEVGLSYSASLPVLLQAVFPHFLGDTHTFSDVGYWGQPFFPSGSPFFLSLYLGPLALLLAGRAGTRERRLWGLVGLGVLLSLGAHGPLAPVLAPAFRFLRVPTKLFLLATLAMALLAGWGLERARARPPRPWVWLAPGALLLLLALASARAPARLAQTLALVVPPAGGPLARQVIATRWPGELAATGGLALGAGLALARGGPLAGLAGALLVLDLLRVNGPLNPSTDAGFYRLRAPMARAVEEARAEGPYRWFSYGVAHSPPLVWNPAVVGRDSDVWLYYVDRQTLMPRTQVLDRLEGAFDVDRMGLAPEGATLTVAEASARRYREHHDRLRLANVRWVLSFLPLPDDLLALRTEIPLPEVQEPLRLYEIREPLPRAFWVPGATVEPDPGARSRLLRDAAFDPTATAVLEAPPPVPASPASSFGPPRVRYELVDPHTVRVRASTPPGLVVVLDGYHPDWTAEDRSGPVPLFRADGRYRAIVTPGGERVFTLRYRPRWRGPALLLAGGGLLGLLVLLVLGRRRGFVSVLTGPGTPRAMLLRRVTENVSESDNGGHKTA
jgi:hypothetical protein